MCMVPDQTGPYRGTRGEGGGGKWGGGAWRRGEGRGGGGRGKEGGGGEMSGTGDEWEGREGGSALAGVPQVQHPVGLQRVAVPEDEPGVRVRGREPSPAAEGQPAVTPPSFTARTCLVSGVRIRIGREMERGQSLLSGVEDEDRKRKGAESVFGVKGR